MKDMSLVNCVSEQLTFSVDLDDEVQCRKSYHLVASLCHSGTLAAGHYTAHVLHKQDSQWLLCNDKAVLPIQSSVSSTKATRVMQILSCNNFLYTAMVQLTARKDWLPLGKTRDAVKDQ